jgi:excisionase family DNA binding protein
MTMTNGDYALSIPQAAAIAGISPRTMWRLVSANEIKSIRASARRRIIMRSELDRHLSQGVTQ